MNRGPSQAELTVAADALVSQHLVLGIGYPAPPSQAGESTNQMSVIETQHDYYGLRRLLCEGQPTLLFTENETNTGRLYGDQEGARYVKDSFHDYVVQGEKDAVNPDHLGTKAAAQYVFTLAAGATKTIRLRFTNEEQSPEFTKQDFDAVFTARIQEANEFYDSLAPSQSLRRCSPRPAAGLCRSALEQTVLPLRRQPLAQGRSDGARAAARTAT